MRAGRTDQPIRTPIYLGDEQRARRMVAVRQAMGFASDSEMVRAWVDEAARQLKIVLPGDQMLIDFKLAKK